MGVRLVPISFPHFEPQTFLLEVAEEGFVEMGIFAQLEFLQIGARSGGEVTPATVLTIHSSVGAVHE